MQWRSHSFESQTPISCLLYTSSVLFIMENPYRTQLNFSANPDIAFSVSHEYPQIDDVKENRFRIYLTNSNPVSAAKLYRSYVNERGNFKTLEQKAAENPDIRKLYGAPFIYLWGDFVLSADNINWPAFRNSLSSPVMEYLLSFSEEAENGSEFRNVTEEIKKQDYVDVYQKNIICGYISQVLKRDVYKRQLRKCAKSWNKPFANQRILTCILSVRLPLLLME